MRIFALLALVTALVASRPAEACGVWRMTDVEKSYVVLYHINSAAISNGKKRVGAVYLDDEHAGGLRSMKGKKVQFDVKGTKLTKYGKRVATIDGATVTFGKRIYSIVLTNQHDFHGMAAWDLVVKRGDEVIITSDEATALCAPMHRDPPATTEQMQEEVRRRVMYYLAWREVGG